MTPDDAVGASGSPAQTPGAGEERGGRSRIFRNFGALTGVKIASDLFTFLFFVVLSRIFGQEGIGQYSFAMALTGFFAIFGDFGLYNLTIKEASVQRGSLADYFGRVLLLRLALSLLGFSLLLAVLPFVPVSAEGRLVVLLIGVYQFAYRLTYGFASLFVARERMGVVAALEFGLRFVTSLAGIAVALLGGSLVAAVALLPAVACLEVFVAAGLAVRHFGAPNLRGAVPYLLDTARRAVPYGMSSVLFQLQARVDVFFLGLLLGVGAAGVYNAAYRVVFLLSFLTYYAGVALFPAASRLYVEARDELRALYRDALRIFALLGIPAAAGLALVAPELVAAIFGDDFTESARVLQLLCVLLVTTGLKNLLGFFLMACEGQGKRVRSQWIAASLNVALNWLLIPVLGLSGAVAAVVTSEMLLVGLLFAHLKHSLGWPPIGSRVLVGAAASAGFALPALWLGPFPALAVVPAAVAIYTALLFAFPDVRNTELRRAAEILRSLRGRAGAPGAGALGKEGAHVRSS